MNTSQGPQSGEMGKGTVESSQPGKGTSCLRDRQERGTQNFDGDEGRC